MDQTNAFLKFVCDAKALQFGEFTLKSGRISPYFFNAGLVSSGASLVQLGDFYAKKIHESGLKFDVIFGPAYKGIPLAVAACISLHNKYGCDVPYIINRKEAKDHGEGGSFIGSTDFLEHPKSTEKCRILVVDDVITAGTAFREVVELLRPFKHCQIVGLVLALDREERVDDETPFSAVSCISRKFNIPVLSIASYSDIVHYVQQLGQQPSPSAVSDHDSPLCPEKKFNSEFIERLELFRKQYGAANSTKDSE